METAKIFSNGGSQAVRIPMHYRFESNEVFIRQNPETGEVILSEKPQDWDGFMALLKQGVELPEDFLSDRDNDLPKECDLF